MTQPYTNVYALLDDANEVIRIQKVELTKGNISELKAKYGKHLRLGVLVLDPTLISLLPLRPEVYAVDPSKVPGDISKLKMNLLGHFLTEKTRVANYKATTITFMIVRVNFRADEVTLWGYTCKMDTLPLCESYSVTMKQTDLLRLLVEKKVSILESFYEDKIKSRVTYTLSKE